MQHILVELNFNLALFIINVLPFINLLLLLLFVYRQLRLQHNFSVTASQTQPPPTDSVTQAIKGVEEVSSTRYRVLDLILFHILLGRNSAC